MHELSYTTSGADGHAVLFLHGFMGDSEDWRNIANELGEGFRAVAADLPGHGASISLPETSYSMDGAANAALRTLDELEIRRASVVGYSMGGRLALYLALRHPERFERLLLESASPGLKTEKERAARRKSDEEKAKRLETGDLEIFLREWCEQPLFSTLDQKTKRSLVESRKASDPRELAKSLRFMGTGSQPSLWGEIKDLRVPTLAVAGELDEKFTSIAREMAEASPLVHAHLALNVGHNAHVESPESYAKTLREYLGTRELK